MVILSRLVKLLADLNHLCLLFFSFLSLFFFFSGQGTDRQQRRASQPSRQAKLIFFLRKVASKLARERVEERDLLLHVSAPHGSLENLDETRTTSTLGIHSLTSLHHYQTTHLGHGCGQQGGSAIPQHTAPKQCHPVLRRCPRRSCRPSIAM